MNTLILKTLGIGALGIIGVFGTYIGINEDIKWKNSINYPTYYWNKYHKDSISFNYDEEDKWEFLFNYTKFYFWFSKSKSEESNSSTNPKWQIDSNYEFDAEVIAKVKNKVTNNTDSIGTLLKNIDSDWDSKKNNSRFSNLSEEWKKYRELCLVMLKEYTTNNNQETNIQNNCTLKFATTGQEYAMFENKKSKYLNETNFWEKYTKFKTKTSE